MTDDASLHDELMMLPDYFSSINKEKKSGLKKITKTSTVCQLLNAQQIGKTMIYEYCKSGVATVQLFMNRPDPLRSVS